ncbi:MAG TPA: GYD domain-containing protein [Acetobacteraceae bacterium]|nr:GYD domain-containing protein [Acetobacteraceae bacterium]
MAHFMLRWQFTTEAVKALVNNPQDRTGPATALIEGFGGKLLSYHFALGEYDGFGVCEFPDTVAIVACSMKAASTGAFAKFESTPLLTAAEGQDAMRRAKEANVNYRAPNA